MTNGQPMEIMERNAGDMLYNYIINDHPLKC